MEVKSVGTFPVRQVKLATPPLPPQAILNFVLATTLLRGERGDEGMNPKPIKKPS